MWLPRTDWPKPLSKSFWSISSSRFGVKLRWCWRQAPESSLDRDACKSRTTMNSEQWALELRRDGDSVHVSEAAKDRRARHFDREPRRYDDLDATQDGSDVDLGDPGRKNRFAKIEYYPSEDRDHPQTARRHPRTAPL